MVFKFSNFSMIKFHSATHSETKRTALISGRNETEFAPGQTCTHYHNSAMPRLKRGGRPPVPKPAAPPAEGANMTALQMLNAFKEKGRAENTRLAEERIAAEEKAIKAVVKKLEDMRRDELETYEAGN